MAQEPVAPECSAERLNIDELLKQEDRSGCPMEPAATVAAFEEALASFKPLPCSSMPEQAMPLASTPNAPSFPDAKPVHERSKRTQRRWFSALRLMGLWALLLALVCQWLWIERRALVAAEPRLNLAFEAICRMAWPCVMTPPQVRNGMVIESSAMTPREEGGFLLSWSWRNATEQPLQTPALELTLLNSQDQVLVRRVVTVAQLGSPLSWMPGQIWDGQLVLVPQDGLMPMGYRLLAFYP